MLRNVAAIAILGGTATAGGLQLPERGARAVSRAGAIVAGADDAESLWEDPAGLAHLAGDGVKSFVFEAVYLFQDSNAAGVGNQQPGTLLPTLAAALGIGDRLVIAGGITAPTIGVHSYDPAGPERYASTTTAKSSFTLVTVGAAYALSDRLRVGATLQDLVSHVASSFALSLCTTRCPQATLEADAALDVHDYIAPSGSLGIQYDATRTLALGLELQAPTRIAATGGFTVSAGSQMVVGDRASIAYSLPATIRGGAELHAGPLHLELALDIELWSLQDNVTIAPESVTVGGAALAAMTIPRHDRTSFAPSLGGDYRIGDASFSAGIAYETSATPAGEVSALAIDAPKLLVGLGGGYASGGWRIGATAGFAQLADVAVTAPKVPIDQPLGDPPSAAGANAGTYKSRSLLVGLRLGRVF